MKRKRKSEEMMVSIASNGLKLCEMEMKRIESALY